MVVDFDFSSLAFCSRQPQLHDIHDISHISKDTTPQPPPPFFALEKSPWKHQVALRQRAHMFHLLSWRFARIAQVCLAPVATDQVFVQGGVLGLLGFKRWGSYHLPGGGFNGKTGGLHTVRQLIFKLNGMEIFFCQYWWQFITASTWNIQKFWEFLNYEICCYNFWDLFCHLTLQDFDIHLLLYRTPRNTGKMESIPQNNKTWSHIIMPQNLSVYTHSRFLHSESRVAFWKCKHLLHPE